MNLNHSLAAVAHNFITRMRSHLFDVHISLCLLWFFWQMGSFSCCCVFYGWAQPHLPSSVCVCVDQHLDIKAIWTAHSEAQPAHPPQFGSTRPGREELPGKQTAGGSGASGERAVSWCHVRTCTWPLICQQNHLLGAHKMEIEDTDSVFSDLQLMNFFYKWLGLRFLHVV